MPYPFHEVLHEQKGTEVNHNLIGNCFKWTSLGLQPVSIIDQVIGVWRRGKSNSKQTCFDQNPK
ncbi:hypothetical protein XELAEV_18044417mg [Xenopus laevis]|uniref:Uncharacterized protein n=1 Tax=Xenopus laevis TaxID=8355 RepID=A0A974H384_XENLA|nr:hypothetical protein XELAEV_18044417mg [Xenopus laevis]